MPARLRLAVRRGVAGQVPVRAAVVVEPVKPIRDRGDASPDVGEREARPVGEVPLRGRSVVREVADRQFGERLAALQLARSWDALGEQGVRVLAFARAAAADQRAQLRVREQHHEQHAGPLGAFADAAGGELRREFRAGQLAALGQHRQHRVDRAADRGIVQPVDIAQRLACHPPDPWRGQLEQPSEVVRARVVPCRPQHVRANRPGRTRAGRRARWHQPRGRRWPTRSGPCSPPARTARSERPAPRTRPTAPRGTGSAVASGRSACRRSCGPRP